MKHKISTRLYVSNMIIVFLSLVLFLSFSTFMQNKQIYTNSQYKLMQEHKITLNELENTKLAVKKQPYDGSIISFVFNVTDVGENIIPIDRTNNARKINNSKSLKQAIDSYTEDIQKVKIENKSYLLVQTEVSDFESNSNLMKMVSVQNRKNNTTSNKIFVVSLLPYEEITTITKESTFTFVAIFLILALFSFVIMIIQAKKLTRPITKLSKVANEYANRHFENTIVVNQSDEIGELSVSIKKMVDNLLNYEKSEIKLFRNLSHDLKTPLTAISGYAEGVANGYYKDIQEPMRIIQEESIRIKCILDDLILLSKLNSNSEEFHFAKCDINKIIIKSLEKIESLAILNDIDLIYTPKENIYIYADEQKMLRVFINILSNALKHTKDKICVDLTLDKDVVTVILSDNGNGFDDKILETIFSHPIGETPDGNGIGMVIVKEIIERHNGKVYAYNDNGACIKLNLNICQEEQLKLADSTQK